MNTFLSGTALLAMTTVLLAADAAPEVRDLAPTLGTLAAKHKLPGVVGAIVQGDQVVALGSAGIRKFGEPEPFNDTDIIHLGSDTKAMTAILVGQLIDKKQLAFDTTMQEIFPKLAKKMNAPMAKVAVRQLLDHTAGLPHDLDWRALDTMRRSLPAQRRVAVEKALADPPATPVGSFSYSNVGYVVLGAIVEAKSGKSWEAVIKRDIFRPLGMTSAGFGPPGTLGKVDQPWGHTLDRGKITPTQIDNAAVLGPAGTVHCSMADWCKFIAETLRGAQGHPRLVTPATFKELITPRPNQDYAGGWIVTQRPWAGGSVLTHAGSNTTWFCNVWIAPQRDFAVLIATNYGSDPVAQAVDEGIGELIKLHSSANR
ncbi:MAG: serine hydrolase domain-containing protein [Pirellulales bacterium]